MLAAEKISLSASVTADYGDRIYECKFKYADAGGTGELTILEPSELAGLTATVSGGGVTLRYDGAALDTGELAGGAVTPAGVIPALLEQWRSGYITESNLEKLGTADTLALATELSETVAQRTWFDVKTGLPLRAELADGGRMVLAVTFENALLG
jgi:hypothetical protein